MEWIEVPEEGLTLRQVRAITARNQSESEAIRQRVEHILQAVQERGDEALKEFTAIFDGPFLDSFLVTEEEIDAAVAAVGSDFMAVLEEAAANIRTYHERQVETTWMDTFRPGVRLGAKFTPIQRVGVYVPGGTAAYPSTVLMDIIPAHVAGVPSIAVFTPPKKDGSVNPYVAPLGTHTLMRGFLPNKAFPSPLLPRLRQSLYFGGGPRRRRDGNLQSRRSPGRRRGGLRHRVHPAGL